MIPTDLGRISHRRFRIACQLSSTLLHQWSSFHLCSAQAIQKTSTLSSPMVRFLRRIPCLFLILSFPIAIDFCFPGPTKTVVFPEALRTPALLGSILYMAYANLSSLRGWSNPELALVLKTAAISHVNKKLSHPSTATCTNVIASIAYLSTGTWVRFLLPVRNA